MRARLVWLSVGFLLASAVAASQGPLVSLMQARVKADTDGALSVDGTGGACGTTGPLTVAANVQVKADANGALFVCGTFANPAYEAQIAALEARLAALEVKD